MRQSSVSRLALLGLLVALSAVGSFVKIPSLTGTPALDSAPGYFAAFALGAGPGAVVAALGHLLTAVTAGLPLGFPIHALIAAGMAGCAALAAWACRAGGRKAGVVLGAAVGLVANGVGLPALFIAVPGFGTAFFAAMLVPLIVASALNVGLAAAAFAATAGLGLGRRDRAEFERR